MASDASALERRQVWVYLLAVGLGLGAGRLWPGLEPTLEALIWPALVLLLYATFAQVPLLAVRRGFGDRRFLAAALTGNFVIIPLAAWGMVQLLPADAPLRLGLLLVLLVPCTDWFITFTQLGRGDVPRAIALTPVNLALQLPLLPLYLWLMAPPDATATLTPGDLWPAALVVAVPLLLAAASERWLWPSDAAAGLRGRLAFWPVPLLALVLFLVASTHVDAVVDSLDSLAPAVAVAVLFLAFAAVLAVALAKAFSLEAGAGRTLAFSFGTRNSFLVLPIAVALPEGWEMVAVVIAAQSLVELLGMIGFIRLVPGYLFRAAPAPDQGEEGRVG